jgi:hypothetical protein
MPTARAVLQVHLPREARPQRDEYQTAKNYMTASADDDYYYLVRPTSVDNFLVASKSVMRHFTALHSCKLSLRFLDNIALHSGNKHKAICHRVGH